MSPLMYISHLSLRRKKQRIEKKMISDDFLPQPYRFVNKIVQGIVSDAMEEIGKRLERGFFSEKQLILPPTMKCVTVQQRVLSPVPTDDGSAPSRPQYRTAVAHANGVTIEGFSSGEIIVASRFDGTTYRRTVPSEGGIVAVDLVAPRDANPTFAAATATSASVTTVDVTEPLKAGDEMTLLLNVTADMLQKKHVSSILVSPDGLFVAVTVADFSEVLVFAISAEQAGAAPIAAVAYNSAQFPATDRPRAVCAFFCDRAARPTLGYYKESQQRRPLAHTLLIAWEGTNIITRQSLREYNSLIASSHENARKNLQSFVAARLEQQTSPTMKDAKGKGAAAAQTKASPAAEVPSPSPAAGASASIPLYDGRRDTSLSEPVSCLSMDSENRLAAVGCRHGVIHIETSEGPSTTFRSAPHRAHAQCKRLMYTSSIFFAPERSELVATHVTKGSPNGSMVVAFDLRQGSNKQTQLVQRHLPANLFAAVPCGQLPLVLYVVQGRLIVVDKQTSNILSEVKMTDVTRWPSPADVDDSGVEVPLLERVAAVHGSISVGLEEVEVRFSSSETVGISLYELVFALYPAIREVFGSCPIETLVNVLDKVPHALRADRSTLSALNVPGTSHTSGGAGSTLGQTQGGTGTLHKRASTVKSSKASTLVGPAMSPTKELIEGSKRRTLPASATVEEKVLWTLEQREATRNDRKGRLQVLLNALDATLK